MAQQQMVENGSNVPSLVLIPTLSTSFVLGEGSNVPNLTPIHREVVDVSAPAVSSNIVSVAGTSGGENK